MGVDVNLANSQAAQGLTKLNHILYRIKHHLTSIGRVMKSNQLIVL